jgi:hypothetical protein
LFHPAWISFRVILDFVPADLDFLHAPSGRRGLPPDMKKGGPQAALDAPLEGRMLQAE